MKRFSHLLEAATAQLEKHSRNDCVYTTHYRRFNRLWGKRRIERVTTGLIDDYVAERIKQVSKSTVLHELAFLSGVFSYAKRRRLVVVNPVSEVKKPSVHHNRCRWLSKEEAPRLKAALDPLHWSVVRFAILTGMRRREQFALQQRDIRHGFAHIRIGKNGRPRRVPLSRAANEIARLWTLRNPGGIWLFHPDENDRERLWRKYGYKILKPALRRAGIEDFTWRDLRHTFASWLAEENVSLHQIGLILGHTNPAQTLRYAHVSDESLHAVVEKIGAGCCPS